MSADLQALWKLAGMPQARELKKSLARKRLLDFVAASMPSYRVNWHHQLIAEKLEAVQRGEISRLMISVPPRHGKALEDGTPIPTMRGWVNVEDIREGDEVFGPDGQPVAVIATAGWKDRALFKVTTGDGRSIVVDENHDWTVRLDRGHPVWKTYSTKYLAGRASPRRPLLPRHGPVAFPEAELPIPPYTLGIWLGDGSTHHASVTSGDPDRQWTRDQVEADGFTTRMQACGKSFGVLGLSKLLRGAGLLGEKRIPPEYLSASIAQRTALLQGLIDTDGYVAPTGQIEFCSTTENLAQGVVELVNSLGVKATIAEGRAMLYGKDCGPKFRVSFYYEHAARLPRRKELCRNAGRTPGRYLSFEPAGRGSTTCIQVDSDDGLFLAGRGYIVTHNSELVTRMFPAWALGLNPDEQIISCSYNTELAADFNRDVQKIMMGDAYRGIFPNTRLNDSRVVSSDNGARRNSRMFEIVDRRGCYIAAGIGGGITGKGCTIGIIDDPIKNPADAYSETFRRKQLAWYRSAFMSRDEGSFSAGGGMRVVLCMTRWHEDDLAGGLIREMEEEDGDQWDIVNLPAILDCEPTPGDPREDGEALWPFKFDLKTLNRKRKTEGTTNWNALYQQRPGDADGGMFKRDWWQRYEETPRLESVWTSWDMAFKGTKNSDYVVGQVWGRAQGNLYLLDQVRGQWEFTETVRQFLQLASKYPQAMAHLVESAANGPAVISALRNTVMGIIAVNVKDSKVARAAVVSPVVESHNVYIPKNAPWILDFLSEVSAFPRGKNDDQVDAMTQAIMHGKRSSIAVYEAAAAAGWS